MSSTDVAQTSTNNSLTTKFQSYIAEVAKQHLKSDEGKGVNISKKAKDGLNEWLNLQGLNFVTKINENKNHKTIMPSAVSTVTETFFAQDVMPTVHKTLTSALESFTESQKEKAKAKEERTKAKEATAANGAAPADGAAPATEGDAKKESTRQSKSDMAGLNLPVPRIKAWLKAKGEGRRLDEGAVVLATAALEGWLVTVLLESHERAKSQKRKGINADDVLFVANQKAVQLSVGPEKTEEQREEQKKKRKERADSKAAAAKEAKPADAAKDEAKPPAAKKAKTKKTEEPKEPKEPKKTEEPKEPKEAKAPKTKAKKQKKEEASQ